MTAGSFRTFLLTSPRPQGDRLCVCPQDTPFTDLTGGCKDSQVTWCAFACQTPEPGGVEAAPSPAACVGPCCRRGRPCA